MKQITFKDYRVIDLMLLSIMTALFEALTTLATNRWFDQQPVALSITLTMACLSMMRWGAWAVLPTLSGSTMFCLISGASFEQVIIYLVGTLGVMLGMLLVRYCGKERIRRSPLCLLTFAILTYCGMTIGRWGVSVLLGGDKSALVVFMTTDIISLLFAAIILLLLRNTDGMLEDQKAYLFRLERERREEENGGLCL